jgi:hypothetical protein
MASELSRAEAKELFPTLTSGDNALISDQRSDLGIFGEVSTTTESREFDDKVDIDFLGVKRFHQVVSGAHGTTGSEDIVVEYNDIVGGDSVAVDFDSVFTILFVVGSADSVSGEFAGFTNGYEASAEFESEYRAADKSARFDANNFSDTFVAIDLREVPADDVESAGVLKYRSEVLEDDALLRKIIDVANSFLNVFHDLYK